MLVDTSDLISIAETLPIDLKIELIDKLLNSLHPSQTTIDTLWAQEAENRLQKFQKDETTLEEGEEVFAQIWQRLKS